MSIKKILVQLTTLVYQSLSNLTPKILAVALSPNPRLSDGLLIQNSDFWPFLCKSFKKKPKLSVFKLLCEFRNDCFIPLVILFTVLFNKKIVDFMDVVIFSKNLRKSNLDRKKNFIKSEARLCP